MAEPFTEAKQRWVESMEARVRDRSNPPSAMAPWDEMTFFQPVRSTGFVNVAGPAQLVARSDPMRVGLVFSNSGPIGIVQLSLGSTTATPPILLPFGSMPYTVLQKDVGLLCQVEWYAVVPVGGNLTVWEISLREFNK